MNIVGVSPDLNSMASGHQDGGVRIWDVTTGDKMYCQHSIFYLNDPVFIKFSEILCLKSILIIFYASNITLETGTRY